MSDQSPRQKLAEVIRTAKTGPALNLAGWDGLTADQEKIIKGRVRVWLDSWIVPQLVDVSRRTFPPTVFQLNHFVARQTLDVQKKIDAEVQRLRALGYNRPAARRKAALDEWRSSGADGL